ncbi:EGF-like domain-containing protein [Aphelenchoides fujianensis]|nr:EGF-like domain-containing protein [Aphelenchoides fujianensis]
MLRFVLLLVVPLAALAFKDKTTDEEYNPLVPLSDVPVGCSSPKDDYAIVDGGLEKCSKFAETGENEQAAYEKFKCKHLRVHGQLNKDTGKCECKPKYKGPVCNDFIGCPEGHTLYARVCAPPCRHNGTLAFSSLNVECTCKAPWDGRFCERLACWRMAPKEHERRWKNAGDHCECAKNLKGDNCDIVTGCENGEFSSGRCNCVEGYKGETCAIKCTPGVT